MAVTGQAAMKTSAESLSSEISQLRTSLLTTSQEFEEVRKQANAVEDDVIQSVSSFPLVLKPLKRKHFAYVILVTFISLEFKYSRCLLFSLWSHYGQIKRRSLF